MLRLILLTSAICLFTLTASPVAGDDADLPWSFSRSSRPDVPASDTLKHGARVQNAVDAFVLQTLEQKELEPAPVADKYTLVRRAYFDLLGLPPSPEQVDKFVNDQSPEAWLNLLNELLDSKHYGERWGRHWLDVARYADSQGFEGDNSIPNAWRYRDYVVQSFNEDKPYDRFVQEQIAADEIWPDNTDLDPKRVYQLPPEKAKHLHARIGTGFYCLNPQVAESALDATRLKHETLTDWADTTSAAFMGVTMGCARCHDHKFDPITQQDYYGLQAIFASSTKVNMQTFTPMEVGDWHWLYPRITAVQEAKTALQAFRKRTSGRKLTDVETAERQRLRDAIVDRLMEVPDNANSVPNSPFDILMQIPTATVLARDHAELLKPVHFLERGELHLKKHLVEPAMPASLAKATDRQPQVQAPFGSRKEFALWLTQPDHPLTARVMANRIWHWHFGRGIVETPNDFGNMGAAPSHRELLDWLAHEFVERDWSIKAMHRLIMTSNTYQMSSRYGTARCLEIDPDNRLLWRMNRRRLEAEALWDSVHATAGTINLKMGGRPVVPPLAEDEIAALREKWHWPISGDPEEYTRRGLYIMVRRNFRFPMFDVFDAPITSVSCPSRDITTVAPQALWTLNSPSVFRQAKHLAGRVVKDVGNDRALWPQRLWVISLGRPATDAEQEAAIALMQRLIDSAEVKETEATLAEIPESLKTIEKTEAAAFIKLCLAVYNLNEFAFVD